MYLFERERLFGQVLKILKEIILYQQSMSRLHTLFLQLCNIIVNEL